MLQKIFGKQTREYYAEYKVKMQRQYDKTFYTDVYRDRFQYNLEIEYVDDQNSEYLLTNQTDKYKLFLRSGLNKSRERFIIAHIYGHISQKYQFDEIESSDNSFKKDTCSEKDLIANLFAAQYLIPKSKLEYVVFEEKVNDVEKLSEIFMVSIGLMHYRLNIDII